MLLLLAGQQRKWQEKHTLGKYWLLFQDTARNEIHSNYTKTLQYKMVRHHVLKCFQPCQEHYWSFIAKGTWFPKCSLYSFWLAHKHAKLSMLCLENWVVSGLPCPWTETTFWEFSSALTLSAENGAVLEPEGNIRSWKLTKWKELI